MPAPTVEADTTYESVMVESDIPVAAEAFTRWFQEPGALPVTSRERRPRSALFARPLCRRLASALRPPRGRRGADKNLGWFYAVSPKLPRYSMGPRHAAVSLLNRLWPGRKRLCRCWGLTKGQSAKRQLLLESALTVAEVAMAAGYSNTANFSTSFRASFGATPNWLRDKDVRTPTRADGMRAT